MLNYVNGVSVKIEIPNIPGHPLAGETIETDELIGDLESISVSNSLAQTGGPGGVWSIQFSPRPIIDGKPWAQVIPNFAVVRIKLWRPAREAEQAVMLGIREQGSVKEDYGKAINRTNSISGASMGRLAQAFKLYTILQNFGIESKAFLGVKDVLAGILLDAELLTKDQPPQAIIGALLDKYIESLNLLVDIPSDATPPGSEPALPRLGEVAAIGGLQRTGFIRYDKNEFRCFDPDAKFPVPPTYFQSGSLWTILGAYADPTFHELFVDTDPGGEFAEVVFRPKPFATEDELKHDDTLFDTSAMDGTKWQHRGRVATVAIYPSDVIRWEVTDGVQDMFNLFWVLPANGLLTDDEFKGILPPEMCIGDDNPSDLRRFGVRAMEVRTGYLPVPIDDLMDMEKASRTDVVEKAVVLFRRWQRLLKAWYQYNPVFLSGTIVVQGRASFRIGDRLLAFRMDGVYEFYIEAFDHRFTFGPKPEFTTTLHVTRGFRVGSLTSGREASPLTPDFSIDPFSGRDSNEDLRTPMEIIPELG